MGPGSRAVIGLAVVLVVCHVHLCDGMTDGDALLGTLKGDTHALSTEMMNLTAAAATGVVASFVCKQCRKTFHNGSGLGSHYSTNPTHAPTEYRQRLSTKRTRRRRPFTFRQKRKCLLDYDEIVRSNKFADPVGEVCRRNGIKQGTFSGFKANRVEIFQLCATKGMANKRKNRAHADPDHPVAESILYGRFVWRRRYLRRRVNRKWFRKNMLSILKTMPDGAGFTASNRWVQLFQRRWDISYQCRSNKHTDSILDRLPIIRSFHQWLIYGLQRSEPQRCPKYGRFPPKRMFHMDQVPCPFSPGTKRTLNMRGEPCAIKEPGGEASTKRMCTLQVTICADPLQQCVPLEIIFRNSSGGAGLSKDERDYYKTLPGIRVRFQGSAWADENIMMDYFRDFRRDTAHLGEVLLGMDRHGSQKTPLCRAFLELMHIVPAFTPANCTDCTSPVDHHVGKAIKDIIATKYEAEYEENEDEWHKPKKEGGLSDKKKRMLVAKWASEAWAEFITNRQHTIVEAFVETGFLLAKDGSENHLIKLSRGTQFADYSF